jgi:two-component system chemotaxis response regulator CheY
MHALVIDDSRTLRRILGDILRKLDFQVSEAANGREGLEVLAREKALNVVLVDWNMPKMNGLEFLRAVRADRRYANLPLMMVTTETELEQVAVAMDAGANEYMMKPFDMESVADKLRLLGVLG